MSLSAPAPPRTLQEAPFVYCELRLAAEGFGTEERRRPGPREFCVELALPAYQTRRVTVSAEHLAKIANFEHALEFTVMI